MRHDECVVYEESGYRSGLPPSTSPKGMRITSTACPTSTDVHAERSCSSFLGGTMTDPSHPAYRGFPPPVEPGSSTTTPTGVFTFLRREANCHRRTSVAISGRTDGTRPCGNSCSSTARVFVGDHLSGLSSVLLRRIDRDGSNTGSTACGGHVL